MFFVYAIQSLTIPRIYVGFCGDLKVRIAEHNAGKTKSTKGFTPWVLFYFERVNSRSDARIREKFLKGGSGKEYLKAILASFGDQVIEGPLEI